VVKDEVSFFYKPDSGIPEPIHLSRLIEENKICRIDATDQEMAAVLRRFDRGFIEGLHPGELEALALLLAGNLDDHLFCTSDGIAIQAAVMLGLRDFLISLEKILQKLGLQKPLDYKYREDFQKKHLKIGGENLVRGFGVIKP
jgi:hypothetical protein